MDKQIEELHSALLKIVKEVHRICVDNDIKYFMMAGTMLGAVRHKGFIPWDDDIDIGMTYDNFKRFIDVFQKMNHPWLTSNLPLNKSYRFYLKLYDKNTTMKEGFEKEDFHGVFIDIFPIVYGGNTFAKAKLEFYYTRFINAMLTRKVYELNESGMLFRVVKWLSRFFSKDYLISILLKRYDKLSRKKTKLYTILGSSVFGDTFPTEVYDNTRLYDFEDTQLYGVVDYDRYLRSIFGDYMQLPSENKRVPKHIFFLDLNKSYLDYQNETK